MDEYTIQKRIRNGDIKEFEKLFKMYYAPLCRYAYSILNDMDLAEEIVQDFFYNYWKNRESIAIQLSVNAYLYGAIRNNCLAYLRHVEVKNKYEKNIGAEQTEEDFLNPQKSMEMEELYDVVENTLSQLPSRIAKVFRMSRFEGKKYQEIADDLAVSVKTVEADMSKALNAFRQNFKRCNNICIK